MKKFLFNVICYSSLIFFIQGCTATNNQIKTPQENKKTKIEKKKKKRKTHKIYKKIHKKKKNK